MDHYLGFVVGRRAAHVGNVFLPMRRSLFQREQVGITMTVALQCTNVDVVPFWPHSTPFWVWSVERCVFVVLRDHGVVASLIATLCQLSTSFLNFQQSSYYHAFDISTVLASSSSSRKLFTGMPERLCPTTPRKGPMHCAHLPRQNEIMVQP